MKYKCSISLLSDVNLTFECVCISFQLIKMLAIKVSIPSLKIVRHVQFWPWQFDVGLWTTNMNAHYLLTYLYNWLTEQERRRLTDVGESEL